MNEPGQTEYQVNEPSKASLGASPWTRGQRMKLLLWECSWPVFCRWTPKPANRWRLFLLKLFGAKIHGTPFVHQRARIQIPWNVELHDQTCIGDRANLYSLDRITIGARSIVAQEAYLCTGSHALSHPNKPLKTAPIEIGNDVFIGARAFLLPGVKVNNDAVIGACQLVRPRKS